MTEIDDLPMPRPLHDWLSQLRAAQRAASGAVLSAAAARAFMEQLTRAQVTDCPAVALIQDAGIPGPSGDVPVRIYHPDPAQPLPVLLYLHGGGHLSGSVAVYDPIVRKLALASRHLTVAVDYRLAPEHPYPAALEDCQAVVAGIFDWLERRGLRHRPRLALAGDSAGGALCATLVHRTGTTPGPRFARQALIYPGLDYTLSQPSVQSFGTGYLLEQARIHWMFDAYLPAGVDRRAVSPLFMPLPADYPPTLILAADRDPLRDEARAYARRLDEHGVSCTLHILPGLVHAYLQLENLVPEDCRWTYETIGAFLTAP